MQYILPKYTYYLQYLGGKYEESKIPLDMTFCEFGLGNSKNE